MSTSTTTPAPSYTNYINKISGIKGGGAKDIVDTSLSAEKVTEIADQIKGYSTTYVVCSEENLAHAWYLKNKVDGLSDSTRESIETALKDTTLTEDGKIKAAYKALQKDPSWKENSKKITADQAEITKNFENRTNSVLSQCGSDPCRLYTGGDYSGKKKVPGYQCPDTPRMEEKNCSMSYSEQSAMYEALNKAKGTNVDFAQLVGHEATYRTPYVPSQGASGVTVATGVDFGAIKKASDLPDSIKNDAALLAKITPLLGKKGRTAACAALKTSGRFILSKEQVSDLNKMAAGTRLDAINSSVTNYGSLDKYSQTVLFSRYYQQGSLAGYQSTINAMRAGKVDEAVTALTTVAGTKADYLKNRILDEAQYLKDNKAAIEAAHKARVDAAKAAAAAQAQ